MTRWLSLIGILLAALAGRARAADETAWDYLIQKVCVDPAGKVQPVDPYDCANPAQHPSYAGYTLRNLRPGEPVPYHKMQTNNFERHDSYPAIAPDGRRLAIQPFDYNFDAASNAQFGQYQPGKGYDLYLVTEGWAGGGGTSDSEGFATTFFGPDCQWGNGWLFFPASLSSPPAAGRTVAAIHGQYWEHNGDPWPGWCRPERAAPSTYGHDLTTWSFEPRFPFGGMRGEGWHGGGFKYIDAIYSIHGFIPDGSDRPQHRRYLDWLAKGHLEAFHFTKLYGHTRWEAWRPTSQIEDGAPGLTPAEAAEKAQHAANECAVTRCTGRQCPPITMDYEGIGFTLVACADTSGVEIPSVPETEPPSWPVADLNLLANFHFNSAAEYSAIGVAAPIDKGNGSLPGWQLAGTPGALRLTLANSTSAKDLVFARHNAEGVPDGRGVRYLTMACDGDCKDAALYQDVPVSAAMRNGLFTYGAIARTETPTGTGRLRFTLSQLDAEGHVLDTRSFTAEAGPVRASKAAAPACQMNRFATGPGGPASQCGGTDVSVFRASSYLSARARLAVDPRAGTLRYAIAPESKVTFDLLSAWLMQDDRR